MKLHRDDDDHLERVIREAAPTDFAPGFENRVMRRLAVRREEPGFSDVLERQFMRIVPLAAAASLLLAAYNWWGGRATAESALDAALNLPSVSIASAYSPAVLYGSQSPEPR